MQEISFSVHNKQYSGLTNNKQGKPLLVCLHGYLDNAASFLPLSQYLDDYHVIALDLMGHGNSSHYADGHFYQLSDYVYDLYKLLVQENWSDIVLVGHSLGGIVASMFAATFPERIQSLVCIESFGPLVENADTSCEQLRLCCESRLHATMSNIKQPKPLDAVVKARLKVSEMREADARLIMSRNLTLNDNGEHIWRTDRKLRTSSPLRLTEAQAIAFIQGIKCKTLVVFGLNGYEKLKRAYESRYVYFSDLSFYSLNGGHYVHMESAKPLAARLIGFLSDDLAQ
ncbi:alpha/beta fold hydrolase [Agaribacter flavus]|uniref:Alpha/beta fold hydrolase n=1 Tax=Agaribacter flavus TaxID=1902781 RepID=A0ABV7FNX7_9ALTE